MPVPFLPLPPAAGPLPLPCAGADAEEDTPAGRVVAAPVGAGAGFDLELLETAGRTGDVGVVVVDDRTGETAWVEPLPLRLPPPQPP